MKSLSQLQEEAIVKFPAKSTKTGYETYCNFALQYIASGLGFTDLNNKTANEIIDYCSNSSLWEVVSWPEGVCIAKVGRLAFLGAKMEEHGHVASVCGKSMVTSPSWGIEVPILCNIGKPPNGPRFASACFLKSQIPDIKCFVRG